MNPFRLAVCTLLMATFASAQSNLGNTGMHWTGSSGTTAGEICGNFTCVPAQVNVTGGELVTLRIRGDFGAPAFVLIAPTAPNCITVPGVFNEFILDSSVSLLLSTALLETDTMPMCPGGLKTFFSLFPSGFAVGQTFCLQTFTAAGGAPALTGAIQVTVI